MAIVYRNGRAYVYKSVRRNGRVTSEYRGSGLMVALARAFAIEDSDERDSERFEQEAVEAAERPLIEYHEAVEKLARAALFASGYHLHKREWRKRRAR